MLSPDELATLPPEAIAQRVRDAGIEADLLAQWSELRDRIRSRAAKLPSVNMAELLRGLESLLGLTLGCAPSFIGWSEGSAESKGLDEDRLTVWTAAEDNTMKTAFPHRFQPAFRTGWLLALACLGLSVSRLAAYSADTWSPGDGWNLVWNDEFDGTMVNGANWGYDLGGGGWGNNELETYTAGNAAVQNGELVITAAREPNGSYTSARLKTQGKRSWQYGKIAARIRLPYGQGIWPAFWMMGENISSVGWPKCGETDIMEMIGGGEDRDDTCYGTIHWDENRRHKSVGSGPRELPDPAFFYQDYHVFEIEWNSSEIIWRLDGTEHFRASVDTAIYPGREEFHRRFLFC